MFASFQAPQEPLSTNLADNRDTHKLNSKTANKQSMAESKKNCCSN